MAGQVAGLVMRSFEWADSDRVLDLINIDRVPGQPETTAEMLAEAVAGRSDIDSGWWAELSSLTTEVAVGEADRVAGAVSYARRARDNAGVVLWVHAGENPAVLDALIDHALRQLAGCTVVEAFSFASALGVGLEALPVRHRPYSYRRDATVR